MGLKIYRGANGTLRPTWWATVVYKGQQRSTNLGVAIAGEVPTDEKGNPALANELYEYIIAECKKEIPVVQTGKFGADMQVSLTNDGPFTIMLE